MIEGRPVLELGDEDDIGILRVVRLSDQYLIARNQAGSLGRLLLFFIGRSEPMHVIIEMAVDGADEGDILYWSVIPIAAISVCHRRQRTQRHDGAQCTKNSTDTDHEDISQC